MQSYKNIYKQVSTIENLELAFKKAKRGKTNRKYVKEFEENLDEELKNLKEELENLSYRPKELTRFIVRDPKTRIIHASNFRDRIVYHALVNILEPIFEKVFIYDSYASRKNKGVHKAVLRFCQFAKKVSKNGQLLKLAFTTNNIISFVLKADIRKYFETVDHEILLKIIKKKIKDENIIWLIKIILANYEMQLQGVGMPLGNLTSQFFANIYLNELDYFVKHTLKAKYYIRYVDDFVILHRNKNLLQHYKEEINTYLKNELRLSIHPNKTKLIPLRNGITFLGYRVFYHYKLLRKSNKRKFYKKLEWKINLYNEGIITYEELIAYIKGWFGYALWANTYHMKKKIDTTIENARLLKLIIN